MPKGFDILAFLFSFALTTVVSAQTVYVYKDPQGNSLISNREQSDPKLKLVRRYTPSSPIQTLSPKHYDLGKRKLKVRATKFDNTIYKLADAYKQDRALIKAIVQIESAFNPQAVSPKGAQGLMQLMPATAASYRVNNPFDAYDNLRGGIAFFSDLMQRYENDVNLALAAYNAGPTAVKKYKGIPPYPETQAYVKYVRRLHKNYQRLPDTYS